MPVTDTNKTQAADFLDYLGKNYDKHLKNLAIRLSDFDIDNAYDCDDILNDTIIKVHAYILKNGLTEGTYYNAYLNTSLNNDILRYKEVRDKKKDDFISIDFLFETELSEDHHHCNWESSVQFPEDNEDVNEANRNHPFQPYSPFAEPNDFSESSKNDHMKAVLDTFNTLPAKYRDILRMVANGLKYKEIGRALNLTIGQVKMRVMAARKLVKAQHNIYPDAE